MDGALEPAAAPRRSGNTTSGGLTMPRAGNKSVRFSQIVERSGIPHVHTLWLPPDKDPELQRAQKAHRVMTIEQGASGAGTADVGTVGFKPEGSRPAQFLIFPKSLQRFDGARVVGIKFDLVAQPELASADVLKAASASKPRRNSQAAATARRAAAKDVPRAVKPSPASAAGAAGKIETTESAVVPFEIVKDDEPRRTAADRKRWERSTGPAPKQGTRPTRPTASSRADGGLVREIRAAMKELQRGKSVAAYQRLERAIAQTEAANE